MKRILKESRKSEAGSLEFLKQIVNSKWLNSKWLLAICLLLFAFCLFFPAKKASSQTILRWEQIKPISAQLEKTTPVANDLILIEDSADGQKKKYIKFSKFQQTLQQVTDLGNTVSKSTTATSDSTFLIRTDITQTAGSAANRLYGFKNYTTYSGAQPQLIIGGIATFVNNIGTGTIEGIGGIPLVINTSSGSSATNIYGFTTTITNRGKFNKLSGHSSFVYNYNRDIANNDAYGSVNTFINYGFLDDYSGFQVDAYNEGEMGNFDGLLIGLHGDSLDYMTGVNLGGYTSHNWSGTPKYSRGIFIDKSIDRGTIDRYSILSESRALSRLYGNFQLDTLRGTVPRLVGVDANGLFSATKKDSISYWNQAFADKINSMAVTGTSTKTITLFQQDGSTITANFTDNEGSGGSGIPQQLHEGIVTDRNIDLTITDYTPSNKDIIKLVADDDIADGDSVTVSINGGTAYPVFEYNQHDKDYALELMYLNGTWFVVTKMGEEASLKGNVDATHTIFGENGITLHEVDGDTFQDNTLVPKWWVLQQIASSGNNSTQTLVGTTPYWDVTNGKNAGITLVGTTTITLANLQDGDEGSLYVTNGSSSSYRITFAGYSVQIYPSVWYSGDEVAVSGSSKTDVFSYKYFGGAVNKLVINGALDVK